MNFVRGVALISVAGACCAAGPDTVNSLAEKSGGRVAVVGLPGGSINVQVPTNYSPAPFPKAFDPWRVTPQVIGPKSQIGDARPMLIPTEITGHAELIPTQWPDARIFLCNK